MTPVETKSNTIVLSVKVKTKVTMLLILVSVERARVMEYVKYEVSISHSSKVMAKVQANSR